MLLFSARMRVDVTWGGAGSFIYRMKNVFCMNVECNLIYALFSLVDIRRNGKKKFPMVLNCSPDLLDLLQRRWRMSS